MELRLLYSHTPGSFSKSEWANSVRNQSNLAIVGTTIDGTTIGGFTGNATIPAYDATTWIGGSDMFVFNLALNRSWVPTFSSLNIWINTFNQYADLIDFGYHSSLQFEGYSGHVFVRYFQDPRLHHNAYDFEGNPDYLAIGLPSEHQHQLISFKVYQVHY